MKITKKLLALVLVLTMTLGLGVTANAASDDKPILALGADLSADQRATVLGLLGVDESDLANYDVISITNAEEHQYLLASESHFPAQFQYGGKAHALPNFFS